MNSIGITFLSILLATATCNNSGSMNSEAEAAIAASDAALNDTSTKKPATAVATPASRDSVEIVTSEGTIVVVLYNETPKHHDNFLKLVTEGYYNDVLFHRVIKGFMIQTGDPLSKDGDPSNDGTGGPSYKVPAEFNASFKHNRGTLAAARDGNPEMASSGSQFYICHQAAPWLDGQYTIFGETVSGIEVVDKIANTAIGANDRPVKPIKIISTRHINAPKAK